MSGISIPIGGDLGPLEAAFAELATEIRALSSSINRAFAPAARGAREVAGETRKMARSAKTGKRDFLQLAQGVTAVGANVGQIAVSVMHFKSLKAGVQKAGAAIRTLGKNPALKKIAIGAAAAGAAILGTVVAIKTTRAALRTLGRIGSSVFRGIRAAGLGAFRAIGGAARGISRMLTGGGFLGGALRLAGVAGVFALATQQLKGAFEASTGFEDMQVRMEQFTGDAEKARSLIEEMTDFSTRTPFETKDVLGASAKLLSAGIGGDIGQLTRQIAAVAKDGQQLADLADAVAKGFAKGKFQTEELNKFLERGINLMPELAAVTGLTGDELKKAIEAGLSFDQVSAAIARLSAEGGQFFGLLERQSKTTTGLVSTLKSAWDEVRRSFAQPILDALKPVLTGAIDRLNALRAKAAEVGQAVRDIFLGAFVLVRDGQAMQLLSAGFRVAVAGAIDLLMRGLRSSVAFLASALPPIFESAFSKLQDPLFWQGVGGLLKGVAANFAAEIRAGLGRSEEAAGLRRSGALAMEIGGKAMAMAGDGRDVGEVLATSLEAGLQAAAEAGLGPSSKGYRDAIAAFRELLQGVATEVGKLKEEAVIPGVSPGATGEGAGTRLDGLTEPGGTRGQAFTFADGLARVGGGGFGRMITPMVSLQQRTNQILQNIESNTRDSGSPFTFAPA